MNAQATKTSELMKESTPMKDVSSPQENEPTSTVVNQNEMTRVVTSTGMGMPRLPWASGSLSALVDVPDLPLPEKRTAIENPPDPDDGAKRLRIPHVRMTVRTTTDENDGMPTTTVTETSTDE